MFVFPAIASLGDVTIFALVVGRMAGILAAIPMFGSKAVPVRIKAALIMAMALLLFPVIKPQIPPPPADTISLALLVIKETLIGLTLGMISQVIFAAVEFCGQLVGMQMGIAMASLFDPNSQNNVPTMALFEGIMASLLFLAMGGHHIFIQAIVESYRVVPVGAWHVSEGLIKFLIDCSAGIFILGLKLAAPVMVSLLATTVALGIMARTFPQMNIFMISMPLNIGVGFLILGLSLQVFVRTLQNGFGGMAEQIRVLFKLIS